MNIQQFAQKGIVIKDNKILLLRYSDKNPNPNVQGKLGLPGGRLQFGEKPDESLEREILEETKIIAQAGMPVHVWNWIYTKDNNEIQINAVARICRYISGTTDNTGHQDESLLSGAEWYPIDEIINLNMMENQKPALEAFMNNKDFFLDSIKSASSLI